MEKEILLIIQALGTTIARKKQKLNRLIRKVEETALEEEKHQLQINIFKTHEDIKEFENLKEKYEKKFRQYIQNFLDAN